MNKYVILMASVFAGAIVFAQNEQDVYRLSNTFVEGSARFEGMAGSFGGLGAESGCIRINPAGFGRYSNSTFNFGLGVTNYSNTAHFKGTDSNEKDTYVRVPNLSGVIVNDISANRSGFLYSQIGFGLNRVANFNNNFNYKGTQFESLLDVFCQDGTGVAPVDLSALLPFTTSLAYESYAIDVDNSNNYYPDLSNGDMYHERSVLTKGGINEWYVNFSTNYLNKLYLGGSLSIQTLNYDEATHHKETVLDTVGVSLRSFDYYYHFNSKGSGSNLKLGAIFLPIENMRLGFSFHSPTFFELVDKTDADMTANRKDGLYTVPESLKPEVTYKYRIWTPTKFTGSFAYVFGTKGCVNIDLEYTNYAWGKLKSTKDEQYTPYSFTPENAAVKARFKSVLNARIGAEYVILTRMFLRAGFGYYPNGDVSLTYGKGYTQQVSGGLGFRFGKLTLDLAIKQMTGQKNYITFQNSEANIDLKATSVIVGLQYKIIP